jgi:DNA-binding MarR family transcriptional regulator
MVEEELLSAWIEMSLYIKGNRILSKLSFNEITIFNYLLKCEKEEIIPSFTDICNKTKLLKSQINRILGNMEKNGYINKIKDDNDKRKIYIKINKDMLEIYNQEHKKILVLMSKVCNALGYDKASELAKMLHISSKIVDEHKGE